MRIAVIGAGGLGAFFGGILLRAGQEVHFVVTKRHIKPLHDAGLRVTTSREDFTVNPASVVTDPVAIGEVDLVLLTVKTYQLDSAIPLLEPLLGENGIVVTVQNGVTTPAKLQQTLGDNRVVAGLANLVSYLVVPGHVRQLGGRASLTVGSAPLAGSASDPTAGDLTPDPRVTELVVALRAGGVAGRISEDISKDLWRKFALITSFGGVCTLANANIGEVRSFEPMRELLTSAIREVQSVAGAYGVQITEDDVVQILAQLESLPPSATSSMQRDLNAGAPSELDEQTGAVVRLAAEAQIPTPINSMIYRVLSLHRKRGQVSTDTN